MLTNARLNDVLDPDKVQVVCKKHNYLGNKLPPSTQGCKDCWFSYYIWDIASTPPEKRQERLDELESVIRHAVEYEQKGKFDFEVEPVTQTRIIKDGFDDETGEYLDGSNSDDNPSGV